MSVSKETILVGAHFRGADICEIVKKLPEGTILPLVREPSNQYDPNAIKVLHANLHIGYIPTREAEKWAPILDRGAFGTATIVEPGTAKPTIRVAITPVAEG